MKQLGDTYKLKGNSFYGKIIEDLMKHQRTTFTTNEDLVDKAFRSPFFEDLEEINGAFEIKEHKRRVNTYQCSIANYQLAKLRMLEFYYDFLDFYFDRRGFELLQMDTDSFYIAWSAENIDDFVEPELREEYDNGGKAEFLSTSEYHDRTPGLFKKKYSGERMIILSSKCYRAEDENADDYAENVKFSCKGVSKKQNPMSWDRYLEALIGSINKAQNMDFRHLGSGIVTYTQEKLGLSAYYDKKIVAPTGIHMEHLR